MSVVNLPAGVAAAQHLQSIIPSVTSIGKGEEIKIQNTVSTE